MKIGFPASRVKSSSLTLLFCLLTGSGLSHADSTGQIDVGLFSAADPGKTLPDGWRPLTFSKIERHTDYSLVEDDGMVVVKADSEQSASGLRRAISIDPAEYPIIEWSWKVNNLLDKGDVSRKEGDDYPARIYITFAFDPDRAGLKEQLEYKAAQLIRGQDVPYRAISYIWGSNSPVGTMAANTYTDRVMMFTVQGGKGSLRQWVTQQRNVYADYKKAFGEEPTKISGVAIMTDTDNTQESAIAWYGDIMFRQFD